MNSYNEPATETGLFYWHLCVNFNSAGISLCSENINLVIHDILIKYHRIILGLKN